MKTLILLVVAIVIASAAITFGKSSVQSSMDKAQAQAAVKIEMLASVK